jgi:6-phosphogluconolactonase
MAANGELVFVGGYTPDKGGEGEGIALLRRDPETGVLTGAGVAARTLSPSFLAQHPTLPVLYAVNELDPGGTVSAFRVAADGALSELAVRATGGTDPAHLAVSPDGRHLLVANYSSGSVAVHALDHQGAPGERADLLELVGSGPVADRQAGPHAHMVLPVRDDVLVADLGSDRVFRCRLDQVTGRLTMLPPAVLAEPGTGPRHLRLSPDGALFLVGELSGTLSWYHPSGDGHLSRAGEVSTTTQDGEHLPSEIIIRPDGRFVYVANRGPDTVSTFAWDGELAALVSEVATGGRWPRHMTLIEDHLYVANEKSHSVTTLRIDPDTGIPAPEGSPVPQGSPTCLLRWTPVTVR